MAKTEEKKEEKKERGKVESGIVTKESIYSTIAVFSLLAFLILCTRTLIFGEIGEVVHIFLTGLLGYLAYPVILSTLYLSVMGLLGKRLIKRRGVVACLFLTAFFGALLTQSITTKSWSIDGYAKACFVSGKDFPKTAPCGLVGGFIIQALAKVISMTGALVVLSVLTALVAYVTVSVIRKKPAKNRAEAEEAIDGEVAELQAEVAADTVEVEGEERPAQGSQYAQPTQAPPMQSVNANPYATPMFTQRPGVSLSEQPHDGQRPSVDTPVGYGAEQYDGREFLFGTSPAEHYRKNLVFDPNSNVNRRPNVNAQPSTAVRSDYVPSYTGEFENSMNGQAGQPSFRSINQPSNTESVAPVSPVRPTPVEEREYQAYQPTPPVVTPPVEERFDRVERTEDSFSDFGREEPTFREEGTPFSQERDEREETPLSRDDSGYRRHDYMDLFSTSNPNVFGNDEDSSRYGREFADNALQRGRELNDARREGRDGFNLLDDDEPFARSSNFEDGGDILSEGRERDAAIFDARGNDDGESRNDFSVEENFRSRDFVETQPTPPTRVVTPTPVEPPKPEPPKPRVIRPYVRPRLDDFDCRDIEPTSNEEEVQATKESIIATLEDFKITGASIASVTFGPTVTRYNVTLPRSVSPKKVVALDQSIAIDLHSSGVNIYPNYEDGVVSIEVPNKERQFVQLGCMLSGDTFVNAKPSSLMFAMGKDVANRKIYGDISKMIHLLVAGSSGSGKSVFLGSLIISLIYKYSPEELRLILIDPKKTEFVLYNNLPHLMINEIITDAGKAVQSLNWAIGEMNRRYSLFEQMSRSGKYVVNLDQYNEQVDKANRLPKIVIIIDELADLMLAAKKEMEDRIQSLTQKARAAGLHVIVATQRPSTDVITGVIKSNLATRVAFYVATDVDSRVILDQTGAQKLLGKGDFLYTMPGINIPVRVQSAFISPEESQRVVNFIKQNNEAYYDEEATAFINSRGGNGGDPNDGSVGADGSLDPVYVEALRCIIQSKSASISMIQRKCMVGYNRAGKIIEWMEDMGYISPFDGAKSRKPLITQEEFESKYGPL